MPYIPETETTATGSGHIQVNEINTGYVKKVEDLTRTKPQLAHNDVVIEFQFAFFDCPDNWVRKMTIFAKFEKGADGTIIKNEANDGEISKLLKKLEALGLTTITREEVAGKKRIKSIKGICISDKGKLVLDDDSPIKDIESLIETITKGKRYQLFISKDSKGFDRIASFIDCMYDENAAAGDPKAIELINRFNDTCIWLKEQAKKGEQATASATPSTETAFVYVPEA